MEYIKVVNKTTNKTIPPPTSTKNIKINPFQKKIELKHNPHKN